MTGTLTATSYDAPVAGRAPALLRLAHQMLGDRAAAVEVVAAMLSHRQVRRAVAASDDQGVVVALVRGVLHSPAPPVGTPSPLDPLDRRTRAAVVLAFATDWDADGIAEAIRTTPRRVHAMVAGALAQRSEQQWRSVLAGRDWDVDPATDVGTRAVVTARLRRGRRRLLMLAAATAATVVTGAVVAAVRVVTAPPPPPPTAHVAGLLSWPARGPLIRDHAFLDRATALWRAASHPRGRIYVLYAGRVGIGRLAVLQARDAAGHGLVAVVGDHDVTYRHPRLRLDLVAPITDPHGLLLAVPYDGNLEIPGLTSGPGSRILQLLVAPGVDRVEERDLRQSPARTQRPDFVGQPISGGLSEPWLDLSGPLPDTAIRAYRSGRVLFTGIMPGHAVQPVAVAAHVADPPSEWSGLTRTAPLEAFYDDVLWWAQVCKAPDPTVSLVWAGQVRQATQPVRLEFVTCAGGRRTARWVEGVGAGAIGYDDRSTAPVDAYVALLSDDRAGGVVAAVVGTTRVGAVEINGQRFVGRVASAPLSMTSDPQPVHVFDASGRPLRVG